MRLQDAGVDALAPQLEQRDPHQFWSCGGAKLLWAEPAQGPGNPKGHRPRLQPLLDCGTRPAWLPRQEGEGRGAKGSGRRGSLAAARLTSTVSGEGGGLGGLVCCLRGRGSPWPGVVITDSKGPAPTYLMLQMGREPHRDPRAWLRTQKTPPTCLQSSRPTLGKRAAPRGGRAQRVSPPLAGEDTAEGTWREAQDSTGGEWAVVTRPAAGKRQKCESTPSGPAPAPLPGSHGPSGPTPPPLCPI